MLIRVTFLGGGLMVSAVLLSSCAPSYHTVEAPSPLPEVQACLTHLLPGEGDRLEIRSGDSTTRIQVRGRPVVIPATSPSQTGVIIKPQLFGGVFGGFGDPDQMGQWRWNPDGHQSTPQTVSSYKAVFRLTGDSIGPTTITVSTSNPGLYVGMSERCAAMPGDTAQGR